jgi:hypothetical protein
MTMQPNCMLGTHALAIFAVLGIAAWPPARRANPNARSGGSPANL